MPSERPGLEQAGELKIGQVGIANLRVREWNVPALVAEMRERVERAPKLFQRAAVVVDIGSLSRCPSAGEMRELLDGLRDAGVHPVALGFGTTDTEKLSIELGLPLLAKFRAQYESREAAPASAAQPEPAQPAAPAAPAQPAPAKASAAAMLVHPLRSGQQHYAQGRDLTVCAGVSAGAEVIADGSIHVYGALRGRALAGAQGDEGARIFCREFHAELVAIAGQYKVLEDLPEGVRGRPAQVWLENGKLHVAEMP
ncbi:septum site-determining protein MinC [Pseudomarimonas salicorniae]|uniref:Probable septum site-determining protein MinC n=1 Tax=Pseudomarimonas salicorniae TaxID=2933270 RepID=A0ABT0GK77_9GAMM|nr:septum site-determining protein MinC [Lysobacter sp. CAU 1642]MCK7594936.1 septum site-determining protein MinC [Lysobacter sp. CAU 1642]